MTHEVSRRRDGPRFWSKLAAVALLTPGVAACPHAECPVTEIELVPAQVVVGADLTNPTTFEVEARLWSGPAHERKSMAETAACSVTWTVSTSQSWLSIVGNPHGHRAIVKIAAGANPPSAGVVKAKAGNKTTGPGTVVRIVPATVADQDIVHAAYAAGSMTSVLVVNGTRNTSNGPSDLWLAAFVRTALAGVEYGSASDPSWGAAVLDAEQAMVMYPSTWTPAQDQMGPAPPAPVRAIPVALRVAVGGSEDPDEVRTAALLDIEAANTILAENRAGIMVNPVDVATIPVAELVPPFADCRSGDALTKSGDRPGMLHLFYVSSLGGLTGLTCAGTDERPQTVIYIASGSYGSATLIHEVGHALGLAVPKEGHAEASTGFDASNVMAGIGWDTDPLGRQRLTVGQVFRMNADSASWLNWAKDAGATTWVRDPSAPRLACQCGNTDPVGRCPRLVDDVAKPRAGIGSAFPWDCHDRLGLPSLPAEEDAVGLLAGRRWRDPPGECSIDIHGVRGDHVGGTFLQFDNLTRPGKCPSWAAVFFSNHAPIYQVLDERPNAAWTDAAEQQTLNGFLRPPVPVTVHVYYPPSLENQAATDINEAAKVFGEDNRAGLALTFIRHDNLPSPCPTNASGEINVCYSPEAGTTFAVSHLLGRALELPTLADPSDPAFSGNVMQPSSTTRAGKLTLGQVFRIHSQLRPTEFPNCILAPDSCPPLNADTTP